MKIKKSLIIVALATLGLMFTACNDDFWYGVKEGWNATAPAALDMLNKYYFENT